MATNKLDQLLENTKELEDFLHALIPALDTDKLHQGADVLSYARNVKVKIPDFLKGEKVTWETEDSHSTLQKNAESITLVRSGNPAIVGLKIACVRAGKWRICLECSWLWCRIVLTRRF
jgi:hypothetical protein